LKKRLNKSLQMKSLEKDIGLIKIRDDISGIVYRLINTKDTLRSIAKEYHVCIITLQIALQEKVGSKGYTLLKQLKCKQRNDGRRQQDMIKQLKAENKLLKKAITKTLSDHSHLADGDVCTLIELKKVLKKIKRISI